MRVYGSLVPILLAGAAAVRAQAPLTYSYDDAEKRWRLANGQIEFAIHLSELGTLEFESLTHLKTGDRWEASPRLASSPVRFATETEAVDTAIPLRLVAHSVEAVEPRGRRLNLTLDEQEGGFRIFLALELYDNHPVLRYTVRVKNLLGTERRVRMADLLYWNFADRGARYRTFQVYQWNVLPPLKNFQPVESELVPGGAAVEVRAGSAGDHCGWLALRDASGAGLFAGWEFDGRVDAVIRHRAAQETLSLTARIMPLNRLLGPEEEFSVPAGFIGLFRGDWDEAGFRTQRFIEEVLAQPAPEPEKFPYVIWDSWGYQTAIDEETLRRNAELAAKMGAELFVVDLGWARDIGDWRENPRKFPSGLRALSDYVHSLGMKFGLHFALAEAAATAPVALDNPDWLSTETYTYFGAQSLCLAHRPAREWVIEQALRLIDEYGADWILQDGQNMVKLCTRTDHTHDPGDSNYANAVEGLDAALKEIQRRRPQVKWENCENGGNMMTFQMVRNYVTSITNDASGALGSRQAVYGASYPFPLRYTDRYMPERPAGTYETRSYMFGGPWVLMNRLPELTAQEFEFAAAEIRLYKELRAKMRGAKVFHLSLAPDAGTIDAIQAFQPESGAAVAVVTRDGGAEDAYQLRLSGLHPETVYEVRIRESRRVSAMTGSQLMREGIRVPLPVERMGEIVTAEPLPQ